MKMFRTLPMFLMGVILTFSLFVSMALTTNAASSASISASASSVSAGSTITYTVSVSGADSASSAAVSVSYSSKFELVSGEWLKSGLTDFNVSKRQGTLAFTSAGSMNGSLFRLTLRATSYDASAQSVSVNVQIKNGATLICNQTVSASTKITCATHSYGNWSTVSNASCTAGGKQQRSCSVCGAVETRDTSALGHSFGEYSETKAPTCTAPGTLTRTCSRCNQSESKTIAATGHDFGTTKVTKEPTCTEAGEKTGTCKTCGEKVTQSVEAAGHKFGEWEEVTAPTFLEAGKEKRVCSVCKAEETRPIEALGYEFHEPSAAKESVFVYYDVTTVLNPDKLSEKGYVNAKFAIPEGSGSDVRLYFVTESGALEEVASTVSEDGAYLEARLTELGTYVVCKMEDTEEDVEVQQASKEPAAEEEKERSSSVTGLWVVIAFLGIAFIAETAILVKVWYDRKVKRNEERERKN